MKQKPLQVCHRWGIYNWDGTLNSWATTRRNARDFAYGRRVRKIIIVPVDR